MSVTPGYLELDLVEPSPTALLDGVVIDDAVIRLAPVPAAPEALGQPLAAAAFSGPAGIAVDGDGNVFIADPIGNGVLRIGACETDSRGIGCIRGPGGEPGMVTAPRGVAVGKRRRLYVADTGNDRIQAFDLGTFQLVARIDGVPEPWDLAVDSAGTLYAVSHGSAEVLAFDLDGAPVPSFAHSVAAQAIVPADPTSIAVVLIDEQERLVVVDAGLPARLLVYELDGSYDSARTDAWNTSLAAVLGSAASLGSVAAGGGTLYVGEEATGGVLAFDLGGTFLGRSPGYSQRAAGLAVDAQGRLLVHPGSGQAVRLSADGVVPAGSFRIGPIRIDDPVAEETVWQRLLAGADIPDGALLQLYTYTSETSATPPALPAITADPGDRLTPLDAWRAAPPNAVDLLVLNEPGTVLWIGGRLVASSGGSPAISRLHVEHDRDGWLPLLPAIYARDDAGRTFLTRLLALAESVLEDEGVLLDDLPLSFGAASARDIDGGRWLDWLSGWLAFPLDERWTESTRRGAVARAFELNGRRGTAGGLRALISLALGIDVRVSEPGDRVGLWQLDGESASLGFTTQLAGSEAQGAVLGTTATLGASDLIDEEEAGIPLFEDLASRFCVHVYAADVTGPDTIDGVRRLVAREQPAETDAHVCVIEPRARVGFQSTVGVDAIVAAGPGQLVLGDGAGALGIDSALPPRPADEPARLGLGARVGIDARLT